MPHKGSDEIACRELPGAVVRVQGARRTCDGGAFRKDGLVEFLRSRAGGEFEEHLVPARAPGVGRLSHLIRVVSGLERFLGQVRARRVLFFYPEFPSFHPAGWSKLPALVWALGRLRRSMAWRGLSAVLDVEDLPGPQHRTLAGRAHPAGERVLALAEGALAGFAAEAWLPSGSLAERWCASTGFARERVRIVPTGSLWATARPVRPEGGCRLFYAGPLGPRQERGLSELLEAFLASAAPDARLVLAGEGGEWLAERGRGRVELAGPLEEGACRELASGCDWGLVPYPERGYFHEVFPAKLALYTACGLPVLTTALHEAAAAVRSEGVGRVVPAADWAEFLRLASRARDGAPRAAAPWLWKRILA